MAGQRPPSNFHERHIFEAYGFAQPIYYTEVNIEMTRGKL